MLDEKNKKLEGTKQEKYLNVLLCLSMVGQSIMSVIIGITRSIIVLPYKLDTFFIYFLFGLLSLQCFVLILKRTNYCLRLLFFVILIGVSLLISALINNKYSFLFETIGFDFLFLSAPWLFVGFAVRDYTTLKKYIYISCFISLASFIIVYILMGVEIIGSSSYSQQHSYMLLFPAIVFSNFKWYKKLPINIIFFITTVFLMISFGARGPIVSLILYIIVNNILYARKIVKNANFVFISVIFLGLFIIIFSRQVIEILYNVFIDLKLSTRILDRLIAHDFFEDNARISLIQFSFQILSQFPLFGVGVGNDRIILAQMVGSNNILTEAIGWYPHNIFLEIVLHFGIFIGIFLIYYLLKFIYISLYKNPSNDSRDVILIFIGIGFIPLLYSGSYLNTPSFFILIGFCYYQYQNYKAIQNLSTEIHY